MAVKESNKITDLESLSKTKVRGVIALLKLASIIETHGGSNEKVKIKKCIIVRRKKHITVRRKNRKKYDTFR